VPDDQSITQDPPERKISGQPFCALDPRCERTASMLRTHNVRFAGAPRVHRLSGLAAAFCLILCATLARAADPALPPPTQALEAFGWVDAWIRAWIIPPTPEADARRIPCSGAAVTLRLGGRVLGRAASVVGDGADVHRAAASAWREASGRLVVDRDATAEDRVESLAHRVTIELELSGQMIPLEGMTYDQAALSIAPGRMGVAVRAGDRVDAIFPGMQLGMGLTPVRALQAAAGALGLPPVELSELRASHAVTPMRFDAVHLVQVEPGQGPTFLHRGGRVVPQSDITGAGLRAAASAMCANLHKSMWTGREPFGIRGDYRAISGQYEPPFARPRSQALAALALARFAESPGVTEPDRSIALATAAEILADLGEVVEPEEDPLADPVAAAMAASTCRKVLGTRAAPDHAEVIRAFGARATEAVLKITATPESTKAASPEERAVVAWALAELAQARGPDADTLRAKAESMVRALIRESGAEGVVSLMPWLAWAMLELAPEGEIPSAVALRDVRSMVWAHQLGDAVAGTPDLDLEGGVVFSRAPGALPTASTLRVISAMAMLLGDRRLTSDEEFLTELARVRRSLRFVVQLMFREQEAYLARSPDRAIGGVRSALWDPTMSIDATAMGVLTICEALEAVADRAKP